MKAINFVTEISKIKPNKSEIKKNTDFSDEFIDAYINDLQIVKKSTYSGAYPFTFRQLIRV